MKYLDNQKGLIKLVFTTCILVLLVYTGIQFGMPYYRYSAFKSDAKEFARISLGDIEKTKGLIYERAKELKIPVKEDAIQVTISEKKVRVRTSWSETVDLLGLYQKTLFFKIDIEE